MEVSSEGGSRTDEPTALDFQFAFGYHHRHLSRVFTITPLPTLNPGEFHRCRALFVEKRAILYSLGRADERPWW